jgi:hypothetical protein
VISRRYCGIFPRTPRETLLVISKYDLGKKYHHKGLTTENTERHGSRKVDPNSLFREFPGFPVVDPLSLRAVVGGRYAELA